MRLKLKKGGQPVYRFSKVPGPSDHKSQGAPIILSRRFSRRLFSPHIELCEQWASTPREILHHITSENYRQGLKPNLFHSFAARLKVGP